MKSLDLFVERCGLPLFDEMIISWNGQRPKGERIDIYASVRLGEWSPRVLYASWGEDFQSSHQCQVGDVRVYQDIFEVIGGKKADGFRIYATHFLELYADTNGKNFLKQDLFEYKPVFLKLKGLSQMRLNHPRHRDLCSPTSTVAVTRYLTQKEVDPVVFAEKVRDHACDIYGNWVLNVAESSTYLGSSWRAWVERLESFKKLYEKLVLGTPVVVSVRGPLLGSAQPYETGHLLVVTGFDPLSQRVHCMDPAFESDEGTNVSYPLDDFLQSWQRRGNLAYVFEALPS